LLGAFDGLIVEHH